MDELSPSNMALELHVLACFVAAWMISFLASWNNFWFSQFLISGEINVKVSAHGRHLIGCELLWQSRYWI